VLPNPRFGGSYAEGLAALCAERLRNGQQAYLSNDEALVRHPLAEALQQRLASVHSLYQRQADTVTEVEERRVLQQCPPAAFAFIKQRTPAWFMLRKMRPFTASSMFAMLLLPHMPREWHKDVASPRYRQGALIAGECYPRTHS
jgi:hypothetical protein